MTEALLDKLDKMVKESSCSVNVVLMPPKLFMECLFPDDMKGILSLSECHIKFPLTTEEYNSLGGTEKLISIALADFENEWNSTIFSLLNANFHNCIMIYNISGGAQTTKEEYRHYGYLNIQCTHSLYELEMDAPHQNSGVYLSCPIEKIRETTRYKEWIERCDIY